jgi:predicted HicB family RNase H-like nuclease
MKNHLQYKDYIGTVDYSAEDEVFYGKVHGLRDLITFEGSSVRELKSAFKASVEDYLETCRERKKTPEKSFRGSFNIRITADLHRKASRLAAEKNITLNELVKKAIQKVVNE